MAEVQRSKEVDGPVATNTTMGWTLRGSARNVSVLHVTSHPMVCVLRAHTVCGEEKGSETLRPFWKLDSKEISQKDVLHHDHEIIKVLKTGSSGLMEGTKLLSCGSTTALKR